MRQPPKPMRPPMGGSKSIGAPTPVGMKLPTSRPPQAKPFMADGGMGGDPGESDADDMGAGATVSPAAVHYHADEQNCAGCEYMGDGGNCAILKIQVTPEGACSAYEGKSEDTTPEGAESPEEEPEGGPPRGMYRG